MTVYFTLEWTVVGSGPGGVPTVSAKDEFDTRPVTAGARVRKVERVDDFRVLLLVGRKTTLLGERVDY